MSNIFFRIYTYDTYIKEIKSMMITNVMSTLILLGYTDNIIVEKDSGALKILSLFYSLTWIVFT